MGGFMLERSIRLSLSDPRSVALAPPEIKEWGPYQFCGLARRPDGRIQLTYHIEADSSHAYGLPPGCAISSDDGQTWTTEPDDALATLMTASCGALPLRLPSAMLNGHFASIGMCSALRTISANPIAFMSKRLDAKT